MPVILLYSNFTSTIFEIHQPLRLHIRVHYPNLNFFEFAINLAAFIILEFALAENWGVLVVIVFEIFEDRKVIADKDRVSRFVIEVCRWFRHSRFTIFMLLGD